MRYLITILVTLIFALFISLNYYQSYSGKTIKFWTAPKDMFYGDVHYRLSVIETTREVRLFVVEDRHYEIMISKQSVKPELDMLYGHYKEYGFRLESSQIKSYLQKCDVIWEEGGVWFIEPDNHKLFFPKTSFMGGR
jgi:hypothetical protein